MRYKFNTLLFFSFSTQAFAKDAFTHSDHLGSASWITDDGAHPVQYIHYAPYGELIANQRSTTFNERYKFTGKERDAESGYDNFGARFYCSPFGIWTRPDPMLDKTISMSSYMYCNGNPIVLRDPDGNLPQAVVGALVSAAADYAIQVGMNMLAGDNLSTALTHNIDMKSIAVSAATGAIGVGAVTNIKRVAQFYGLGKASTQVLAKTSTVLVDMGTSVAEQTLNDGEVKMEQIAVDVVAGQLGDATGEAVTKWIKKTNTIKCLENKIDRLDRLTSSPSPKVSRQDNLKKNQKVLEQIVDYPSQVASSATQKTVSTTIEKLTE